MLFANLKTDHLDNHRLGVLLFQKDADGPFSGGILDKRLLQETNVTEKTAQLPFQNFFDQLGRFAGE